MRGWQAETQCSSVAACQPSSLHCEAHSAQTPQTREELHVPLDHPWVWAFGVYTTWHVDSLWQRCPCRVLSEATPGLWGCTSWDDGNRLMPKAQRNQTDVVPDDTVLRHLSYLKLQLSACFCACSSGMSLPTWHATRAVHWCRQWAISAGFMTAMIQVGESITQPPGMRRTPGRSLAQDSVIIHGHTMSFLSHMVCMSDLALCSSAGGNIW